MVETAFANGRISNFKRAGDLDLGSGHTAYRRASLTYMPNFIKIKETFT